MAAITDNNYMANNFKNKEVWNTKLMSGPSFVGVINSETQQKLTLYLPWPIKPTPGSQISFFTKNDSENGYCANNFPVWAIW